MPGQVRLLLVEDEAAHTVLIRKSLKCVGTVTAVSTKAAAFELLANEDFDLVLIDIRLPDGSGLEVQSWLMGRPASPPLLFVSGSDDSEVVDEAMSSGARAFVVKRPGYIQELRTTVAEILSGSRIAE